MIFFQILRFLDIWNFLHENQILKFQKIPFFIILREKQFISDMQTIIFAVLKAQRTADISYESGRNYPT